MKKISTILNEDFANGNYLEVTRGTKFGGIYIARRSRVARIRRKNQHAVLVTFLPHRGSTKRGFGFPVTVKMSTEDFDKYSEYCLTRKG
jgi:hypothetical protein